MELSTSHYLTYSFHSFPPREGKAPPGLQLFASLTHFYTQLKIRITDDGQQVIINKTQ
jgi:hypothetical protein